MTKEERISEIKFQIEKLLKEEPSLLAYTFGIDENTDANIIIEHYYDDHYTIGTEIIYY